MVQSLTCESSKCPSPSKPNENGSISIVSIRRTEFNAVQPSVKHSSLRFTGPTADIVSLQTVDSVDATVLVDNSIDILLPSRDHVIRPPLTWDRVVMLEVVPLV